MTLLSSYHSTSYRVFNALAVDVLFLGALLVNSTFYSLEARARENAGHLVTVCLLCWSFCCVYRTNGRTALAMAAGCVRGTTRSTPVLVGRSEDEVFVSLGFVWIVLWILLS